MGLGCACLGMLECLWGSSIWFGSDTGSLVSGRDSGSVALGQSCPKALLSPAELTYFPEMNRVSFPGKLNRFNLNINNHIAGDLKLADLRTPRVR